MDAFYWIALAGAIIICGAVALMAFAIISSTRAMCALPDEVVKITPLLHGYRVSLYRKMPALSPSGFRFEFVDLKLCNTLAEAHKLKSDYESREK